MPMQDTRRDPRDRAETRLPKVRASGRSHGDGQQIALLLLQGNAGDGAFPNDRTDGRVPSPRPSVLFCAQSRWPETAPGAYSRTPTAFGTMEGGPRNGGLAAREPGRRSVGGDGLTRPPGLHPRNLVPGIEDVAEPLDGPDGAFLPRPDAELAA